MEYKISDKLASMKPSAIREIFKSLTDPSIIAFAAGNPAPESFPIEDMKRIGAQVFENEAVKALQYSITEGYPPLVEVVKSRLKEKFDIGRDFDGTVIVSGGQQGLELACKTMCNEGDVVICENPSFIGALNAYRSNGAKLVGVPLDDYGIDTSLLEKALKENPNAKLIYTIPTFHNPAGITMTFERRREVYELAKKYGVMILEDNPYGELRFKGKEIPTLKSMDEDGIVIYCGSFSKVLSAGMRIGFVCAPSEVLQKIVVAKQVEDVHTNAYFQILVDHYIRECDFDAHIEGIRRLYREKSSLMLSELDKLTDTGLKFTRPEGGLFIWCTLPQGISLDSFIKEAMSRKLAVVPGTAFNCDVSAPSDSFRITYSTPSEDQIIRGVEIIGESIRELSK
ncbi:MAG: PLP-dependent aminotransferase family protein [Eubacteriales bacterium]|jgi:2-aminoadipate transaminase